MILAVPSFSPFSVFAGARLTLFDPRNREGEDKIEKRTQ